MKFYGNGAVWDKEKGRILCRFINGEYNTKDEHEIKILSELFVHEEIREIKEIEEEIEETENYKCDTCDFETNTKVGFDKHKKLAHKSKGG